MTISGDTPAAGSQIVVSTGPVKRCRDVGVPGQVLAELMLVGCGDHVRLILIGGKADRSSRVSLTRHLQRTVVVLARIARRAEGMRPAEMDAVHRRELLA